MNLVTLSALVMLVAKDTDGSGTYLFVTLFSCLSCDDYVYSLRFMVPGRVCPEG